MSTIRQLINEILLLEYERVQSVLAKPPAQKQATITQPKATIQPVPQPKAQPAPAQPPQTPAAPITKDIFLDKTKRMFAIGEDSKAALVRSGFTPEEIELIFKKMNTMLVSEFKKYDPFFIKFGNQFNISPELLKAMALEETALLSRKNEAGSTAAGLIQMTQPTLDTFNANLPKGVNYSYKSLANNPGQSIKIAAHYIRHFLMNKKKLGTVEQIMGAYKTGSDSQNYAKRVTAYKKFINLFGK